MSILDGEMNMKKDWTNTLMMHLQLERNEDVHTMGPRSIALLRYELEQNDIEVPSDSVVYKLSRKIDPNHEYKTNGCKSKEIIEKMDTLHQEIEKGNKGKDVDIF